MTLLFDETAVYWPTCGAVRVTGTDRLDYLHTQLSQQLEGASPGTVADFLYLDPKGNPHAAGRAIVHAEYVLLLTADAGLAAELTATLEKYKFLMRVECADESDAWAVASLRGPGAADAPGAPGQPMWAAPHPPGLVVRDRWGGVDLVGPPDWVAEKVTDLDVPEASDEQWEAWRIRTGVPAWAGEIASGRRPQELGLLPTHVHLAKGCYPGQESIAKTYNLGRPRRALGVVELDGPVSAGDELTAGEKTGTVTSAAPTGDRWTALAMLPLDREGNIPGDGEVVSDQVTGRVVARVGAGLAQPGA
jgi:folate-binding protein YgfZ